jgi:LemA protein
MGFVGLLLIVILAIPLVLIFWAIGGYNGLVKLRNRYKNAFAQIDVQLKRRYDLIPNLVEVAKKYMAHESETLEAVILARNAASSAREKVAGDPGTDAAAMASLAGAESGLGGVLGRMFALSEGYPDLKANQNMMQLTEELSSTENKISFARQAYNDAVMSYNNKREMFPSSIIAGVFNFMGATMFEVTDDAEREPVKVDFG